MTPRHDPRALADALAAVVAGPDRERTDGGAGGGRRATPDVMIKGDRTECTRGTRGRGCTWR